MERHRSDVYTFGRFRLEAAERRLLRDDQPIPLPPKAFHTLVALVEYAGHVLTKDELMQIVWPEGFVEEVNLAYTISLLRKALADWQTGEHYIETIPKVGYRFVAPVQALTQSPSPLGEGRGEVRKRRGNLPAQSSSFIGREGEIAELAGRVKLARLLTLTGAGGCGKTRLSLEVAARVQDDFADGAWLVELAPVAEGALVARTAAGAFGLTDQPNVLPADVLAGYLASKHALLILDNCEHLIGACAELADQILRACPGVHVLATSREPLRAAGEATWRVPSLMSPDPAQLPALEQLLNYEAVRLFVERARSVQPSFDVNARNAEVVAQICHRLDGIPLAIELAAARLTSLTPQQIAERLDDRFRLLVSGFRTALPRQQTLRATIGWSVDLLTQKERAMFAQLSVFAGGFTTEAAQAVLGQPDTIDVLANLVDKSLLIAETRGTAARYRMLETIRQYASELLSQLAAIDVCQLRNQHSQFFMRLAEQTEPEFRSARRYEALGRLEHELDNLRIALEWYRDSNNGDAQLHLASTLYWFWHFGGLMTEGRRWLQEALKLTEQQGNTVLRGKALSVAGGLAWTQDDHAIACAQTLESVRMLRTQDDREALAWALAWLALGAHSHNDSTTGRSAGEESVAVFREYGDEWNLGFALAHFAVVLRDLKEFDAARAACEESARIFRVLGDAWGLSLPLNGLRAYPNRAVF